MRDLASEMGLTSASLYNAFGDKRALYQTALDRYVSQSFGDRVERFENNFPPREAIAAFFEEIIERSLNDKERKGCMLVNSALELAPHDRTFKRVVAGVFVEVETFFRRCAVAGQTDGTISTSQSPDDLARLLLGVLLAIRVLARTRPERELMEGLIRPVFALLDDH
jgi:TetR/AcrR family transcriptional repressor of nem operon